MSCSIPHHTIKPGRAQGKLLRIINKLPEREPEGPSLFSAAGTAAKCERTGTTRAERKSRMSMGGIYLNSIGPIEGDYKDIN